MTPSIYQKNIYDAVISTNDNLGIDAVAGSGKSTVLAGVIDAVLKVDSGTKILVASFNVRIKDAFSRKLIQKYGYVPPNVEVLSINGFGWRICVKQIPGLMKEVQANKFENHLKLQFDFGAREGKENFYKWKTSMKRICDLLKCLAITQPAAGLLGEITTTYGIDLPDMNEAQKADFSKIFWRAYLDQQSRVNICDYNDQILYPVHLNLDIPQFDLALIDEAQDLNLAQQNLLVKCAKRIITVGDTHQAIYMFRGADPQALKNMVTRIGAKELPLSICYRCPKKIVELAKSVVPYIEANPDQIEGTISDLKLDEFRVKAQEGDAVLCRCTAPLVSECLRMIREDKRAMVIGRDIGQTIAALINTIDSQPWTKVEDFAIKLNSYYAKQAAKLQDKELELTALTDRVETVQVLLGGCEKMSDVHTRIKNIFKEDNDQSGVIFSTVHKAKGMEWKRVYILEPKLMPHPAAKTPEQREQENNLWYVAVTRAMEELIWIQ